MPDETQKSFIEHVVSAISLTIKGKTIFADPIEHEDTKIIPVTRIRYGIGGGFGHKKSGDRGEGGGGGIVAEPIGYIELKKGQSTFKRIKASPSLPVVILASGIAGFLLLKGVTKVFNKKR
ncbi:spore germination protein GerW family protein [Legionella oakridgensis]|uniref:Sporulation family protein YtfJ n=2 Tax=Legionella oakridgensis TaxID=29423 RepID=W0BGJ7_9GAMM|nr:spore germination protein GerW family protein [Legionella oakridgensis]AHE67559.1 sporulation family protein YtfJ [Legionella oakridgensis ATCC 33761 = DSM 21215]ETO92805.1 sporulation protein YtfJ [Legionella oakridgensis RV-2-2007]KTD37089.1 sporulation protein YtfJ [Legionella oakridgensis]STY20602.1 Uncharacterized conserved protein [Legionella longbeachae]